MVIDTHVHLIRPFDLRGHPQRYCPGRPTSAEDYVALMDASEVDRAFFISWSPEDVPSALLRQKLRAEDAKEVMSRDYALEVMAKFPDRFYWFPCHLGPSVNGDYLRIARENLQCGAAGLKLVCSFWGELPDDARLLPLYEVAEEYQAQIIIDTSFWYLGKDEPAYPDALPVGHREVAKRISDFQDYARHLTEVVALHPSINFQLAHAGARTFTPEHVREVGELVRDFPNVFADLGALPVNAAALDCLVETGGADRVMFGTDWPHFAQGAAMREVIDCIRRPGRFTEDQSAMILGGNALRFVRRSSPGLSETSARGT